MGFKFRNKSIKQALEASILDGVNVVMEQQKADAKYRLSSSVYSEYKEYKHSILGKKVWSSIPGDVGSNEGNAPNRQTGRLSNSPMPLVTEISGDKVVSKLSVNGKIAGWLEYGTVRTGQRPFMRPGMNTRASSLIKLLKSAKLFG